MSEVEVLKKTLKNFIEATEELSKAYNTLKEEVRRLGEELASHKRLLSSILESISDGVIASDNEETIIMANKAAKNILGNIEGKKLSEVIPEDGEAKLGDKIILIKKYPLIEEENEIGKVTVLRDITRERELEEKSKRVERLSAMGEMATAIAHEIRNPLGSIELFAGLIKREAEKEEIKRWAEGIINVVRSINNLISNMLLFARPFQVEKEKFEVIEFIKETVELAHHALREKEIEIEIEGEKLEINADKELLRQVILNLIINAVQAIKERGKIKIKVEKLKDNIKLEISDTGPGIPQEYLEKIFDPFFTTKKKGTGLGLAIVHKIIDAHNGLIKVESQPGNTKFTILLPRDD